MTPIRTVHTTRVLGAPAGWDADRSGPCAGLPVIDSDGLTFSYWRLTLRERLAVLFGTPVRLCVASDGHPPVALDVTGG